jgi:WD40-like Beta Propeller Repeat
LGKDVSLGSERGADVIISPDGSRLVYVSQSRLFTRRLDQPTASELVGTGGAYAPFFSPDGQWVAFFARGKLKKISLQGGPAIDLCDTPIGSGGSWGDDGNIIAALDIFGLLRIPAAGGTPTPITELAPGEVSHRWPQVLPRGRAVLFSSHKSLTGLNGAAIEVMSLRDRRRKTLQRGGTWGRYLRNGHLVYINNGTLFAVPFDPDRLEAICPVARDHTGRNSARSKSGVLGNFRDRADLALSISSRGVPQKCVARPSRCWMASLTAP